MMSFAGIQTKTYTYKVVGKLSLTVDVSTRDTFSGKAEIALLHFHGGFLVSYALRERLGTLCFIFLAL
jgi:hypothetical protein